MGLDDLLKQLATPGREFVTPVTPMESEGVTLEAPEIGAVTLVTPVTPQKQQQEERCHDSGITKDSPERSGVPPVTPKPSMCTRLSQYDNGINEGRDTDPEPSAPGIEGEKGDFRRSYCFSEVTGVTGVTPSKHGPSSVTPAPTGGVTGVTNWRPCTDCNHLVRGVCLIASPTSKTVRAVLGYQPISDAPHNCMGFEPAKASVPPDPRKRAERMIADAPETQTHAYCVLQPDADPVLLGVAVRGKGSCLLKIPASNYDPVKLIELADKCGVRTMTTDPAAPGV